MKEPKSIGDTSRDGSLVIADTSWNGDGVLRVNIRTVDTDAFGPIDVDKARRLARSALMYPEKTRSCRMVKRYNCEAHHCEHITFFVSRLAS